VLLRRRDPRAMPSLRRASVDCSGPTFRRSRPPLATSAALLPFVRARGHLGGTSTSWLQRRQSARVSGPNDPYFGLPLWLSTACCGHVLWAYNAEHLDRLEDYVSARLRERGPIVGSMSMLERLPRWIKEAKHRDDLLRTIHRLRTALA